MLFTASEERVRGVADIGSTTATLITGKLVHHVTSLLTRLSCTCTKTTGQFLGPKICMDLIGKIIITFNMLRENVIDILSFFVIFLF